MARVAHASSLEDYYIGKALQQQIHKSTEWEVLLQYQPDIFGRNKSEVVSDSFFFADNGARDLKAELVATIRAMLSPLHPDDVNSHPRCKFIARYHMLERSLELPENLRAVKCTKFEEWINLQDVRSVSLVFASGYFRNPASFYGHPLLRFNTSPNDATGLLDLTLNNGAIVPPNENPISYMIKGVVGGYDAAYSDTRFFQLNHDYSENDLRDLWIYELDLNPAQIERIAHLSWELLHQRFTYRFFSNNCGYYLEGLLEYGLGHRISMINSLYTVPAVTFFNLVDHHIDGKPLVKKITRLPSRQNRLYEKYSLLTAAEKSEIHIAARDFETADNYDGLNVKQIDVLIDYLSFLESKRKRQSWRELSLAKSRLFSNRLSKTSKDFPWPDIVTSTPPHSGSRPGKLELNIVNNEELGSGTKLRVRPAAYDMLDLDDGHVPNSTLNMFDFEFLYLDDKFRLTKLDLVNIQSLNASRTGLPGEGNASWGLRVGWDRVENSCIDCVRAQLSGNMGRAWRARKRWTLFTSLKPQLHAKYESRSLRVNADLGLIGHLSEKWKTMLTIGGSRYLDGDRKSTTNVRWQSRFGNNPKANIKLDLNFDNTFEIVIGYARFW